MMDEVQADCNNRSANNVFILTAHNKNENNDTEHMMDEIQADCNNRSANDVFILTAHNKNENNIYGLKEEH